MIRRTLTIAYRDACPVRIIYQGKEGLTERVIIIRSITDEDVVAYCRLRRRISTFKLNGILAAETIPEKC